MWWTWTMCVLQRFNLNAFFKPAFSFMFCVRSVAISTCHFRSWYWHHGGRFHSLSLSLANRDESPCTFQSKYLFRCSLAATRSDRFMAEINTLSPLKAIESNVYTERGMYISLKLCISSDLNVHAFAYNESDVCYTRTYRCLTTDCSTSKRLTYYFVGSDFLKRYKCCYQSWKLCIFRELGCF